jgi:hypothetical protein
VHFEFITHRTAMALHPHLGFEESAAQIVRPERVLLFSGRLDSLAGVADTVLKHRESAILVTHQSATTIAHRQNCLAKELARRTSIGQTFYAPVWVKRGKSDPVEHSQRFRSFLFAAIGMAHARMFGLDTVHFCENGITSFNLPIGEQVLGTRASRTTHPRVLAATESCSPCSFRLRCRFTTHSYGIPKLM